MIQLNLDSKEAMNGEADLTEIAEIKKRLAQTELAYHMASEMSSFKAGFLARTAHELRSPLSSLIGLHQLIISGLCESPEEEKEFIQEAHNAALRLVKLLDEVIAVSKIEHGTIKLQSEAVDLGRILQEVHDSMHMQVANRGLRLDFLAVPEQVMVVADPRRLRQVLLNFVDQAVTRMSSGSISLKIAPESPPGFAAIWLGADCDPQNWAEPINTLQKPAELTNGFSWGMNMIINQAIITAMNGQLEMRASAGTLWQCNLPLLKEN